MLVKASAVHRRHSRSARTVKRHPGDFGGGDDVGVAPAAQSGGLVAAAERRVTAVEEEIQHVADLLVGRPGGDVAGDGEHGRDPARQP